MKTSEHTREILGEDFDRWCLQPSRYKRATPTYPIILDETERGFRASSKYTAELTEHDPYTCLMAYWATKPDPEPIWVRVPSSFNRYTTYDPSTVTVTIDGVELTDVLEISYGRKKTKR